MKVQIFFLAFLTAVCLAQEEDICPQEDISPCTCRTYFDGACVLTCTLSSQNAIDRIAGIPNLCNGKVHFILVHSTVSGISAKLWKMLLSSKTVDIAVKHASMEGLIPPGSEDVPEVSTEGSAVIKFDHSQVMNWDWKQLGKFHPKGPLTIVIDDTSLLKISPEFSQIAGGHVTKVEIDHTGLTEVPDGIFANFKDITSLSLQNNELTSVSRSILPKPANELHFIALNGNQLTSLPGDLFAEMPMLQIVYLRENKLTTLPQEIVKYISSKNIKRMDFVRNPWICDCQLAWVLKSAKFYMHMGRCGSPENVAEKSVREVTRMLQC